MKRLQVEEQAFGFHFGDVSAKLASRWNFSDEFITALAGFARPMEVQPFDPLAGIVHLAVWRVALDREGPAAVEALEGWPEEVAQASEATREMFQDMPTPAELAADLEVMIA